MKVFAGIDEAGRGPVLGPMVMAIVVATQKDISFLNKIGVKDSKLLTPLKRNKLARLIKQQLTHAIIKVQPKDIDKHVTSDSSSLNRLEALTSAKLINRAFVKQSFTEVMLDLPSKNKEEYLSQVKEKLKTNSIKVDAEFKADLNYAVVSAASILAKTARDASFRTFEKKLKIKMGSGYPSDPNTKQSLQANLDILKEHNLIRLSWQTYKDLLEKKQQTTLGNF